MLSDSVVVMGASAVTVLSVVGAGALTLVALRRLEARLVGIAGQITDMREHFDDRHDRLSARVELVEKAQASKGRASHDMDIRRDLK